MAIPKSLSKKERFVNIPNPYSPYEIVSGRSFYHKDVINKIKRAFESDPPKKLIVIQGYVGSGKTITIKTMVKDHKILGESYIPIYLDSIDIKDENTDSFLWLVYKAIKNGMSAFGFKIEVPDYSLMSGISLDELKLFINKVEEILGGHKVIILIFNYFEEFMKKLNKSSVSGIFEFFSHLTSERQDIRLILAGKGKIFDIAAEKNVHDFFSSAYALNLGGLAEKAEIEKLIVQPVKNYVEYEHLAIQEIVTITGGNFYCQQLLCNYLIELLNKKKQNICTRKDVIQAVETAIKDKREDFAYFWNKLDYEHQIVAAALADEAITKPKGQYYFIEESSLLDLIFEKDKLDKVLMKLTESGFVNKIDERRFDNDPYKVKLYGEWVKKEHSFNKTIADNLDIISKNASLYTLGKILSNLPKEIIPLKTDVRETVIKISQKWTAIKKDLLIQRIERNLVEEFLKLFCDTLGFEIKSKPEGKNNYYKINMERLNLSGLDEVILFITDRDELSELEILWIKDQILLQAKPGNPSFILCFKKSDLINKLSQNRFLGIVILEENEIKNIVLSDQPLEFFKQKTLLPHVNLSVVSPYKTEGPAINTFYGRHNEIGKICATTKKNFAIFGARKMGKTSLLYKIIDLLPSNTLAVYMDLESPQDQNYKTFQLSLKDKITEVSRYYIELVDDITYLRKGIIDFYRLTGRNLIFFLDEIDRLLKYDRIHNYQLMNCFRSLLHEGYCQVIFSGFEELYNDARSLKSPLYNFCEFIELGPINREDALTLITEPMEVIGVRYNNSDDKEVILKYCYNHPNLLQFFCKNLISKIEEHENEIDTRIIYKSDIENVFRSTEFEEYVINDFYLFMTEDVGTIEKLIVFSLLDDFPVKVIFTETEISKKLRNQGIQLNIGSLKKHLDNLKIRYIFKDIGRGRFSFAIPVFPRLLKKRMDADNIFQEALEDAKKSL